MNFASSIYSKLEPRIEDEIGRTTTTEERSFFVSETRPIIRDVLFSRGKTRALFDIRWVASGGTRRRAKRRRSFSDLGINCKLVYRPQRTLGCWFIRRVVAAFASSSPSSLRSPFNSGSPVPSRPSNSRAWPTTKHPSLREWKLQEISSDSSPTRVFYRTSFNSEERRDKRPLFLSIPSILHEKGKDPIPPPRLSDHDPELPISRTISFEREIICTRGQVSRNREKGKERRREGRGEREKEGDGSGRVSEIPQDTTRQMSRRMQINPTTQPSKLCTYARMRQSLFRCNWGPGRG